MSYKEINKFLVLLHLLLWAFLCHNRLGAVTVAVLHQSLNCFCFTRNSIHSFVTVCHTRQINTLMFINCRKYNIHSVFRHWWLDARKGSWPAIILTLTIPIRVFGRPALVGLDVDWENMPINNKQTLVVVRMQCLQASSILHH